MPLLEISSWPDCKIVRELFRSKVKQGKSAYEPNDPSRRAYTVSSVSVA